MEERLSIGDLAEPHLDGATPCGPCVDENRHGSRSQGMGDGKAPRSPYLIATWEAHLPGKTGSGLA